MNHAELTGLVWTLDLGLPWEYRLVRGGLGTGVLALSGVGWSDLLKRRLDRLQRVGSARYEGESEATIGPLGCECLHVVFWGCSLVTECVSETRA